MLSLCDWRLALAAFVYEYEVGRPIMSDGEYDRLSEDAVVRNTQLPDFLPYTGQWVKGMDQHVLAELYIQAMKYNAGRDDLHHPAIRQALDDFGISYTCCNELPCYDY